MKVAVIEDEEHSLLALLDLLKSYPYLHICGHADGVKSGVDLIKKEQPDLVFLDIALTDGSGFDLLDRCKDLHFNVIFTTAFNNFAIKAFRYNALDYLLKPIVDTELDDALKKTKKNENSQHDIQNQLHELLHCVKKNAFERLLLHTQQGIMVLEINQILRLEADGNYTTVIMKNHEKHLATTTIKIFEEMLSPTLFFRVHQSHIINILSVKKIMKEDGGYVVLDDGTNIPIARRRKEDFIEMLKAGI